MSILAKLVLLAVVFAAGLAAGIKIHAGIIAQRDLKVVQDNARVQILRADKAVSYGDLMEVMNVLRDAGYLKVALVGLETPPKP